MCMAGGSAREAPGPIAILSGTSPRGRARGHLCRTIGLLPSIRFLQPLTTCWRLTAGWTKAGYAGLPSPETLPEEISRWYLRRAVTARDVSAKATLVGVAALSPVTDLTLSGATYETRADADPYFTKQQVAELVRSYLGSADANDPRLPAPGTSCQDCLPSAFTSATTKCCSMTHDDTSSVPLPPVSMLGLMCGWACHMDFPQSSD